MSSDLSRTLTREDVHSLGVCHSERLSVVVVVVVVVAVGVEAVAHIAWIIQNIIINILDESSYSYQTAADTDTPRTEIGTEASLVRTSIGCHLQLRS